MISQKKVSVKQSNIYDCGAACIDSVFRYYNLFIPIHKIRNYCGTTKGGTNILGIVNCFEHFGFVTRAGKVEEKDLSNIPVPAIAHIQNDEYSHFVVIYKVDKNKVLIMDPESGVLINHSRDTFINKWSKVVVFVSPGQNFFSKNEKTDYFVSLFKFVASNSSSFYQIIIASIIITILGLSQAVYMRHIVDDVIANTNFGMLNLISILMLSVIVFQSALSLLRGLLTISFSQVIDISIIQGFHRNLFKLPIRFFDDVVTGDMVSRLHDAISIKVFINTTLFNIITNMLMLTLSVCLMFLYYWKLALITLIFLPIYLLVYYIINKINKKYERIIMEKSASLESQVIENIENTNIIKKTGAEKKFLEKTDDKLISLQITGFRQGKLLLYVNTFLNFSTQALTITTIWAGSYFVLKNELSPGQLFSYFALISYLTSSVSALILSNRNFQETSTAINRLHEIFIEDEVTDKSLVVPNLTSHNIKFDDVSFNYKFRRKILKKITFEIKSGEMVAIIGANGTGKSTITKLLQNTYNTVEGEVTISNLNVNQIDPASIRKTICEVSQNISLINGSVIDNIAMADSNPDIEEIIRIISILGLDAFVKSLPGGLQAIVSEKNISGGEKQKIAIARAIYTKPKILILDEVTSNMDLESQSQIIEAVKWYNSFGNTIILISHKLSTIRYSNRVLMIENGNLIIDGKHSDLLIRNEYYKKLWQAENMLFSI